MLPNAESVSHGLALAPGPFHDAEEGAHSVISADTIVIGDLKSSGGVSVEGRVVGDITGRTVNVSAGGHVEGSIYAERVHIGGHVSGRVEAISVTIARTARVLSNITHHTLTIEPGAVVQGRRPWRPLSFMEQQRKW